MDLSRDGAASATQTAAVRMVLIKLTSDVVFEAIKEITLLKCYDVAGHESKDGEVLECPFCLRLIADTAEISEIVELPCRHIACKECLNRWVQETVGKLVPCLCAFECACAWK